MDIEEHTVPEDWSEVENPDYIVEKYDPRPVTLFTHDAAEVGVHVLPDEPNTPHSDTHRWRVGAIRGNENEFKEAEPFAHLHGRENALAVAEAFMKAYDRTNGDVGAAERSAVEGAEGLVETETDVER
jgi:hypothetical protein